jgi:ABC transport system ATP-binding/permease protein
MPPTVLLSAESVSKRYTSRPLFDDLSLSLFEGDHAGLIGPNGSGKSTLLRILAGVETPDGGRRVVRGGTRVGYVPQDPTFAAGLTVEDVVLDAFEADHHFDPSERSMRAAATIAQAGFSDASIRTEALSGGWRKRLAIASALALEPDVLLLDEPTNHLDVESILWLEGLLKSDTRAFIVVTHDRYFLEALANRVVELNFAFVGGTLETKGRYSDHLEKRDEVLRGQAAYQETLANLVRREVEWLRRGPKARTTKSKARIDNAEGLIAELAAGETRASKSRAKIDFLSSERKTKRLIAGEGLSKKIGSRLLFEDLDLLLTPGARLGILGPNGSGKTTLLRVISGETEAYTGTLHRAERLRIAYFRQNRETLDESKTLRRALAPAGDTVVVHERAMHVGAWAKRFLFRPEQLETSVSRLSGGEKARIVLANLMMEPADLLVLDEPTNDLDISTLEVLEDSLLDFPGAIVLVTHDRYLLDRVSTMILALDGEGGAEYFADYSQWERERKAARKRATGEAAAARAAAASKKKLSWKEEKEWEGMESAVEAAEKQVEAARQAAEESSVAANAKLLQERFLALAEAQKQVEILYARWSELEAKRK